MKIDFMKKYLLWFTVALVISAVAIFHTQVVAWLTPEKPVSKSINLQVYKGNDYMSAVYNDAFAKLHVTVTKVSGKSRTIVWDKTFDALQLRKYPSLQNALTQKVVINNVFDNKEHLEISYTLIYNSKGNVLEMQNGLLVTKGSNTGKLAIPI